MATRTKLPDEIRKASARQTTLDVLRVVYEHNLIRSSMIAALLPDRHPAGVRQTLRILKDARLVHWITEDKYDPDVYLITALGEEYLFNHSGRPDIAVNFYRPREDWRIEYEHKLGISQTIGSIRAGLIDTGARFIPHGEITRLAGVADDLPVKFYVEGGCYIGKDWKTLPPGSYIEPDGLFGVEYAGGSKQHFALEYQRTGKIRTNTLIGVSSMRKKFIGYDDIFKRKLAEPLGIGKLRMLTVFTEEKDHRAALKLAEEMYPPARFPSGAPLFHLTHQLPYRKTDGGYIRAAKPNPDLASMEWDRIGCEPAAIFKK